MLHLSITKIESIYNVARKLHQHAIDPQYNLLNRINSELITENAENEKNYYAISEKVPLRLDWAVPRYLLFNHIFFLSVLLVETNECPCTGFCDNCVVSKLFKCNALSHSASWGGLIGPGMTTRLHFLLSYFSPLFKIHAVFHDAYGHLFRAYKKGPGYNYIWSFRWFPNYFWLGHITGLLFFYG